MNLRQHNERALEDWLDGVFPAQSPGAHNSEEVIEGRKLEGSDPLSEGRLDLLDSPTRWESHRKLMDIFFRRLPEKKHIIYYRAARHVLLSEETAGGYTELVRLESGSPLGKEVAKLARAAFEFALDELDAEGYKLDVKRVPYAAWKQKGVVARQEEVRKLFVSERKRVKSDRQAVLRVAERTGYSVPQVWAITEDIRPKKEAS